MQKYNNCKIITLHEALENGYVVMQVIEILGIKSMGFFDPDDVLDIPFVSIPYENWGEEAMKTTLIMGSNIPGHQSPLFILGVIL